MQRTVRAGAKVTLSLRITGTRADGYHELDALAVCCDQPYDDITIDTDSLGVSVEPPGSAPTDATNLASKALQLLDEHVAICLKKGIPDQAGLGGGSSDAAAVLREFGQNRRRDELRMMAASLGADVPVCFEDRAAKMFGTGEILEFVDLPSPIFLVLATPNLRCPTPAVYAAFDALSPRQQIGRDSAPPPLWETFVATFRNDLEAAAFAVEPRLRAFRDAFETCVGRDSLLCGSGSSYAAWFEIEEAATAAAATVRSTFNDLRLITSTACH